jgi:hypothetical protein
MLHPVMQLWVDGSQYYSSLIMIQIHKHITDWTFSRQARFGTLLHSHDRLQLDQIGFDECSVSSHDGC